MVHACKGAATHPQMMIEWAIARDTPLATHVPDLSAKTAKTPIVARGWDPLSCWGCGDVFFSFMQVRLSRPGKPGSSRVRERASSSSAWKLLAPLKHVTSYFSSQSFASLA